MKLGLQEGCDLSRGPRLLRDKKDVTCPRAQGYYVTELKANTDQPQPHSQVLIPFTVMHSIKSSSK